MKTNREIRAEAKAVVRGGWFGRIALVGLVLYAIMGLVSGFLAAAFTRMSVQSWGDFLQLKAKGGLSGLNYAVPSLRMAGQMTGATLFQQFVAAIFGAIVMFGLSTVLLKAIRNDPRSWFADSFAGFRRPFDLMWLIVLMNLQIFLWSLLLVFPGLIAVYRYRQAWYLKSEHPEWTATACLAESSRLMKGHKFQAFRLDAFFIFTIIPVQMVLIGSVLLGGRIGNLVNPMVGGVISGALSFAAIYAGIALLIRYLTARAVFYREVRALASSD